VNRLKALQLLGQTSDNLSNNSGEFDLGTSVAPLVSGAIMGYITYRTARHLKVDILQARGIGLSIGVTIALGQIANTWLHGWLRKAGVA
jgi:hypothetical protein